MVIMRYLGRKYGLTANDLQSIALQDMVEQQLQDLKVSFVWPILMWNNDDSEFHHKKKIFLDETLPQHLQLLSQFLGHKEWLIGNITYVDFLAYETLDWMRQFSPKCLDKWPNLKQYLERFESLPAIAAYISSNEFTSWPVLGPRSRWGYRK
jgi:glutathione S-transferase